MAYLAKDMGFSTFSPETRGWNEVCYKSGNVRVYDVHYAPSDGVRVMGEHTLSLLLDQANALARCQAARLPGCCPPGSMLFMPANMQMNVLPKARFREVVIPISDSLFIEACRDHIDYSRISFDFRVINDETPGKLASTLRGIVMDPQFHSWPLLVESTMTSLVVSVIKALSPDASQAFANIGSSCHLRRRRVLEYIDDNLHRNITLEELAGVAARSKYHFARLFTASLGMSPLRYVTHRRIEAARRMLRESGMSVAEVAVACGFASQSHMTTVFKKSVGVTPAAFRKAAA